MGRSYVSHDGQYVFMLEQSVMANNGGASKGCVMECVVCIYAGSTPWTRGERVTGCQTPLCDVLPRLGNQIAPVAMRCPLMSIEILKE